MVLVLVLDENHGYHHLINSLLHQTATQYYKFERRHTTKETILVHQLLLPEMNANTPALKCSTYVTMAVDCLVSHGRIHWPTP